MGWRDDGGIYLPSAALERIHRGYCSQLSKRGKSCTRPGRAQLIVSWGHGQMRSMRMQGEPERVLTFPDALVTAMTLRKQTTMDADLWQRRVLCYTEVLRRMTAASPARRHTRKIERQ